MMLSHSFKTNITTGFIKGTPSSDIVKTLDHARACAAQIGHPMLLPVIILSYDLSPANDQKQRDARDWLRRLENAVSLRDEVEQHEQYFQDGLLEVDGLNRDLVECHSHVMWKRPQAYWALGKEMERAMDKFRSKWNSMKPKNDLMSEPERIHRKEIDKLHRSMQARLEFYKVKIKGLENYIHTTLERLKVQREAVSLPPRKSPPTLDHSVDNSTAVQHHVAEGSQAQSRNCRRAASNRSREQAGQHSHENYISHGRPVSPRNISCVRLQHDVLQFSNWYARYPPSQR